MALDEIERGECPIAQNSPLGLPCALWWPGALGLGRDDDAVAGMPRLSSMKRVIQFFAQAGDLAQRNRGHQCNDAVEDERLIIFLMLSRPKGTFERADS